MAETADLCPTIVEMLYFEALILADEARDAFAIPDDLGDGRDLRRIALSREGLRATTRIMHALAWLMNQRAFLRGDLTEWQLRRAGCLPPAHDDADPAHPAMLPAAAADLAGRVQHFYARVERLDHAWQRRFTVHGGFPAQTGAVHRMREWLWQAVASA